MKNYNKTKGELKIGEGDSVYISGYDIIGRLVELGSFLEDMALDDNIELGDAEELQDELRKAVDAPKIIWNKTEDGKYPAEDVQCLVLRKSDKYIETATWDSHYQSWDNAEGDDHLCEKDEVEFWMEYPLSPRM